VRNDSQRCFFCKGELFTLMEDLRAARGFDAIAYGVNLNDQGDFPSRAEGCGQIITWLRRCSMPAFPKTKFVLLARQSGFAHLE